MGLIMIAITVVGIIMSISLRYFSSQITSRMVAAIRDDLLRRSKLFPIQNMNKLVSHHWLQGQPTMPIKSCCLCKIFWLQGLWLLWCSGWVCTWLCVRVLAGVYVLLSLPILLLAVILIAKYSEPLSTKQQKNLDNINGILRENLSGLRVIRAFVNEKFEEMRFRLVNDAYTNSSKVYFIWWR